MRVLPSSGSGLLPLFCALHLCSSLSPPVTWEQFSTYFRLYDDTGPGGCKRVAPNGVDMGAYVLTSINDAWNIAETVVVDLPSYFAPDNRDLRELLFLLFGITWTRTQQPQTSGESQVQMGVIDYVFNEILNLKTTPDRGSTKIIPRFRCLEDYARYYQHLPGEDGSQDYSAPLAAEHYNARLPNGNYFPGLSYVNNRFIPPHTDTSEAFYIPSPDSPKDGACGSVNRAGTKAFTLVVDVDALKGITLCPVLFNYPTTSSLPPPTGNGGVAEIDQYKQTAGMTILHELVHLVSSNNIIDQPAMYPPTGQPWTNRNWASWVPHKRRLAYGYTRAVYLGLSRPQTARANADNYAILALCMHFKTLDCLGTFQSDIIARRRLPFRLPARTAERIRRGEVDLTRGDDDDDDDDVVVVGATTSTEMSTSTDAGDMYGNELVRGLEMRESMVERPSRFRREV